jgi:hypothetical protein
MYGSGGCDMQAMSWLLIGIFLPLFPLSMIFNLVFQRATAAWMRVILLLVWPSAGLWLLTKMTPDIPHWLFIWSLSTAILYALRSVVIKEISVWAGFIATSAWSLVWLLVVAGARIDDLILHVMAFSVPFVLLAILVVRLERQYESAYAGVVTGLAQEQPRMAGILVVVMLAAIGTPLFPSFFSMLININTNIADLPIAAFGIALVWLMWSWSGIRLLQELLVGTPTIKQHDDIGPGMTLFYCVLFVVLVAAGLFMSEVML